MKKIYFLSILLSTFVLMIGALSASETAAAVPTVSGQIVNGLRILPVPANGDSLQLSVFRGDYIKFKLDESFNAPYLSIPELTIHHQLSKNLAEAPYFKMKQAGTFAFTLGKTSGHITVINYNQVRYKEISSAEASTIIEARSPLILDVRTPGEYKRGHLENSVLIPVQVLQRNLNKLGAYKDQEILIYCATGNRSTVASKILIDSGFNHILNLRQGIVDWHKNKYPVVN